MKTIVIGGGISGKIVGYFLPESTILEKENDGSECQRIFELGSNYLWKPLRGFKCQRIDVFTHVNGMHATYDNVQMYKHKIGKEDERYDMWENHFKFKRDGWRIKEYPKNEIMYGCKVIHIDTHEKIVHGILHDSIGIHLHYDRLISTIPLNKLVELCTPELRIPQNIFKFSPIYIKTFPELRTMDYIYLNYISDPRIKSYRFSIHKGTRYVESLYSSEKDTMKLIPGKIWDNPKISGLLEYLKMKDIHCVGRYGKWKSNELIHETFNEVKHWRCRI